MDKCDLIEPVTVLKSRSADLIRRAKESGRPIIITQNGKAAAVLVDAVSYERQRNALILLKMIVQGEEDYRSGRSLSHAKATSRLKHKLEEIGKSGE
ncbi:MAG: type II toxin-antitoxin system Phd/YefM family antitoxin [Myxococcota bacterium]|nr:type II toxin-antitoxin system Phd/YefM family antitoxin [Myxococcota bacterium]